MSAGPAAVSAPTAGEVTAKAFWALGDPIRLAIVELLLDAPELTVAELTARLPVTQSRVSVHLKWLTSCGFTAVRREGRHAHYRLANPRIIGLLAAMGDHAQANADGIAGCMHCPPGRAGVDCC